MARDAMAARYSIGIDLGTTSSALAYVPLTGDTRPKALPVSQWESTDAFVEAPTLPSFLYLPEGAFAAKLQGRLPDSQQWIVGRLARRRAGETPGRVVRSAKSWLCHHTADRSAPILPWGSEEIPAAEVERLTKLGAKVTQQLERWTVMEAPTGQRFCVVRVQRPGFPKNANRWEE